MNGDRRDGDSDGLYGRSCDAMRAIKGKVRGHAARVRRVDGESAARSMLVFL